MKWCMIKTVKLLNTIIINVKQLTKDAGSNGFPRRQTRATP